MGNSGGFMTFDLVGILNWKSLSFFDI